ncbi:MAG: ABC transporter ATP-binding protein/permease [Lachnospiraceae bacterium]|nr:ABC transporter ATP-binding protein/permease [Lachnospiraceae bacterium]
MIKTILGQVKDFKTASFLTPLFMLLEVAMEMVIPLLMASIIDDGVNKGDMRHIFLVGLAMIGVAFVGLFAGVMGGKFGAKASTGLARNLRAAMFRKVNTYSFSNIDKFSTASLVTRMTTDVTNIQNAYQMILRMGVRAPMSMFIAMILSFSISPRLASIYLYAVLILGVFILFLAFFARKFFNRMFKKYDKLNNTVQENINGIRVVKAYVREKYENIKFKNISGDIFKIGVQVEALMSAMMPIMMLMVYGCILLISWNGAKMIVGSELLTGQLMSLLTYCMNILMSLMMLSFVFVMIMMSSAALRRVTEVLVEVPDIQNPENPEYNIKDGSIDFKNVNFGYNKDAKEPVLKDINVSIKSGETIGIMGGTGSAKSTFVSLISRLYDACDGEVDVGGKNVKDYDLKSLRDEVSVVLQQNVLFSGTIAENLRWGNMEATDEEVRRAAASACADEFIDRFPDGYDTYIEQGGTNVSGGQRQRLCIARALLKKPKILILDDSTSAVDTATDAKIRKAFREDIPDTTKIIISQRITSVIDADRILILDDGKVNGFDTPENLLKNNQIYQDIYKAQTEGGYGDFDEKGDED